MGACIGTACQIMPSNAVGFCPNPNNIPVNNSHTLPKVCKVTPSLHEMLTQKQPSFCIPKNPIIIEAPSQTPFSNDLPCFPKDAPDLSTITFREQLNSESSQQISQDNPTSSDTSTLPSDELHHASTSEVHQSDSLRELKWVGAMVAGYLFTFTAYWAALRQRLRI
jgi:hypothetical protein